MLKHVLNVIISSALFMATTYSIAFAVDIYSHIVLKLPYELRNDAPWIKIIQTQEEWESFYNQLIIDSLVFPAEAEPAPVIDFHNFQMIAGGLGVRSSIGDRLLIEGVHEMDDVVIIQVLEVRRAGTCLVLPALSYPSATILIKRTDKPIRVLVSTALDECDFISHTQ
jgi:hypothetical protein